MSTMSTGPAPSNGGGIIGALKPDGRRLTTENPGFRPRGDGGEGGRGVGPDAPTAKSPLWNFEGIHKGSGWNAWSNMAVKHVRDESAALENAGLYLYRAIRRTKIWKFPIGKMIAAKRITRHLKRSQACMDKAAAELVAARRRYAETFGAKTRAKASDFDPEA